MSVNRSVTVPCGSDMSERTRSTLAAGPSIVPSGDARPSRSPLADSGHVGAAERALARVTSIELTGSVREHLEGALDADCCRTVADLRRSRADVSRSDCSWRHKCPKEPRGFECHPRRVID